MASRLTIATAQVQLSPAAALLLPAVSAQLQMAELRIAQRLDTPSSPLAREAGCLLHGAGGKRVRPGVLLTAAALGDSGGGEPAIQAAAGVELLHLASMYHDDVIDQADLRRGRASANARWGDRTATLAGTMAFAMALSELGALDDTVNGWASEAAGSLRAGQTLECERLYNIDVTVDEYFEAIAGKTAALFALSARLGGYLSGLGPAQVQTLHEYGRTLGLIFQIIDDIRDITDAAAETGKAPHADLAAGVYTLPTILCLEDGGRAGWGLRAVLGQGTLTSGEIEVAISQIMASLAIPCCLQMLDDLVRQARAALGPLPGGAARDWLAQLPGAIMAEVRQ